MNIQQFMLGLMTVTVAVSAAPVLQIGKSVTNREIHDVQSHFTTADKVVFAHLTLTPATDETVTFEWVHNGKPHHRYQAVIKEGSRFRTFASAQIQNGDWSVILKDQADKVLAEQSFQVGDQPKSAEKDSTTVTTLVEEPNTLPSPASTTAASLETQTIGEDHNLIDEHDIKDSIK